MNILRAFVLVALVPHLAFAESTVQLECEDLRPVTFHEELSSSAMTLSEYVRAQRSSWLGARHAVGPELRFGADSLSGISVSPMTAWRPATERVVLPVDAEQISAPAKDLESGALVTFHVRPEESERVLAELEALAERDPEPTTGPDLVVLVGGVPLAGAHVQAPDETTELSVPILDRSVWEVASYLKLTLDCEDGSAEPAEEATTHSELRESE